jgi:hypothetical protein
LNFGAKTAIFYYQIYLLRNLTGMASLKLVDGSNMEEEILTEMGEVVAKAVDGNLEGEEREKRIAAQIRNTADEKFGSVWHCVVGKSMAVAIRFQENRFAHYVFNWDWHIYIWKTL